MARTKVTLDDIRANFRAARHHLSEDAQLYPDGEDEGKVVLVNGGRAVSYACSTLKGHLDFLVQQLGPDQSDGRGSALMPAS